MFSSQEQYEKICKPRFESVESRLIVEANKIDDHTIGIAKLTIKVENLTKSLNSLTKALCDLLLQLL